VVVLNFHGVGTARRPLDDGEEDVCLERQQFLAILDAVSGRSDVHLTFDDGNSSDVNDALPALLRRGLRAHFFVCAGRLGRAGFLTGADVRELRSAGMSIGLHGMDHVPWRRLSRPEIHREIVQAKQVLEDVLDEPVDAAACPFGAYDRRSLSALRRAGFERVYTSDRGAAPANDWLVPRNTLHRWDSAESVERTLSAADTPASLASNTKRWIKRWR
jgi:peptidoglycan/xylan/chitin deacetylase (PgdA/CDA1 family)